MEMSQHNAFASSAELHEGSMSRELFRFDEQYLRRLVGGDAETERHFAEYFSVLLRTKLQFRLRCNQEIEDLKQEVFVRVIRCLRSGPGLQHPGKLGAFVNAVCNNVLMEHIRGKARITQWDGSSHDQNEATEDVESQLLSKEVSEQIGSVLKALSPKDRGLLQAIFLDERDKDTVCHDYGVNREYLRVLLHRARRRFRELLTHPAAPPPFPAALSGGAHK